MQSAAATATEANAEVVEAESQVETHRQQVADLAEARAQVEKELADLHRQIQDDRASQVDLVRQAGTLQTQADSTKQQLERFYRDREQRRRKAEQKGAELGSLERVLEDLDRTGADLQQRLSMVKQAHLQRLQERDDLRRQAGAKQAEIADLNVRRSDLRGRIDVLEGLERSQEGLGTGVREVMLLLDAERALPNAQSQKPEDVSLSEVVIGLVAEFLSVPRDVAPLIDLALGDAAQQFIVRDADSLDLLLAQRRQPFAGRVSFLPLLPNEPLAEGDDTATADRWVTCDHPDLAGLPNQLLGNVRIVADRAEARLLAKEPDFAGCRFITRQGELLDSTGALTVGTHHAEAGILSRKSELRDLRALALTLDAESATAEAAVARIQQEIDALDAPIHGLEQEVHLLSNQAGDLQSQILSHRQNRERLDEELALYKVEMEILEKEIYSHEAEWKDVRHRAEQAEQNAQALKIRLQDADQRIQEQDHLRLSRQQEHTQAQVTFAQMEERLHSSRMRFQQIEVDLRRGREESDRVQRHEAIMRARLLECRLTQLRASAELASLHHLKESLERTIAEWSGRRDRDRERRRLLIDQLQSVRSASQEQLTLLHQRELSVRDLENGRNSLSDRIREDYKLEIATIAETSMPIEGDPAVAAEAPVLIEVGEANAVNEEIDQLKEKIRKLGNVSLESLQELQEVETRSKDLNSQHDDLTSAQRSLLEIINKINADSRKLFTETYDAIRTNFQELFRKLFGGGMADVVLENPDDVLESGIEIVARPPGKELRSISLLSGGEKTLTAVGLLFAIFRSKPSPFCLLDEVDAALDEANTARLSAVLREFLDRSQFIVITHKKRTMAGADVLYGITMQESGVSKQVAVRFEDWPEEIDEPRMAA